jgi:hypothetical protein
MTLGEIQGFFCACWLKSGGQYPGKKDSMQCAEQNVCRDDAEAVDMLDRVCKRGAGGQDGNKNAGKTIVDNVNNRIETRPTGNARAAALRRLRKDRPKNGRCAPRARGRKSVIPPGGIPVSSRLKKNHHYQKNPLTLMCSSCSVTITATITQGEQHGQKKNHLALDPGNHT